MKSCSIQSRLARLAILLALLSSGCSSRDQVTYPVVGTVSLTDGTPVVGGRVSFQLAGDMHAPTATARIDADGTFRLSTYGEEDGALEGEHSVLIRPPNVPRKRGWEGQMQRGSKIGAPDVPQIDPRYFSFKSSGLTFTVTQDASKNHFEIQLDPDPRGK